MDVSGLTALQAAAVIGVVEILKSRGLSSKHAAIVAPLVGALLLAAYAMVPADYSGLLNAIVTGLAATGGYAVVGAARGSTTVPGELVAIDSAAPTSSSAPTPPPADMNPAHEVA